MKVKKAEKRQVALVESWNKAHKPGIEVIVVKDDKTEVRTVTESEAFMLGQCREYPGHTAVIRLKDFNYGPYMLERVRPACLKR